jgi:hypothetical protein
MRRHRTRTIESHQQRKSPRSIAANTCRRRRSAHPPAGGVRREAHHAPWTPTSSPVVPLPPPDQIAESRAEFRNRTNGAPTANGASLLGALAFYGLDGIGAIEKDEMRALVLRGGPWSDAERAAILDYCESDVAALARLLPAMLPGIDLPRALLRGRYMAAVARMERTGVPIDTLTLGRLKRHWADIQDQLFTEIDADYGVFEGRTFKADRFAAWLKRAGLPWRRRTSGRLDLSDDAFREVVRSVGKRGVQRVKR